jgi:hypothetical protein
MMTINSWFYLISHHSRHIILHLQVQPVDFIIKLCTALGERRKSEGENTSLLANRFIFLP